MTKVCAAFNDSSLPWELFESTMDVCKDLHISEYYLTGSMLSKFCSYYPEYKTNLLVCYPISINQPQVEMFLIEKYLELYSHKINEIVYSPTMENFVYDDWAKIKENIKIYGEFLYRNTIKGSLFISLGLLSNDNDLFKLVDLAEQQKIRSVIIGCCEIKVEDFLITAYNLKKASSIPISIFIEEKAQCEWEVLEKAPFEKKIVSSDYILSLMRE
jgi:hypothetical protein